MRRFWCTYAYDIDGEKISVVAKDGDEADKKLKEILKQRKEKEVRDDFTILQD